MFLFWANFCILSNLKIMIFTHTKDFSGKEKDDDKLSYFENKEILKITRFLTTGSTTSSQNVKGFLNFSTIISCL